nr:YbjQ family protein [Methylomarinum sp. Ch1-1]MDP4520761.1 YbjQ family protein [Methylomarinum sp. Ch1-1]
MAGLKSIVGGELKGYTELLADARNQAIARMLTEAERKNADAIVNVRFSTSQVMEGAAEIMVYGTAVKLKS